LATLAALGLVAAGVAITSPAQAAAFCLPNMAYSQYVSGGNPRIFFRSDCGHTITQLTTEAAGSDTALRVSPDGTAVAYVHAESAHVDGGTSHDVFVVPTTGGEPTNVTNTPELTKTGVDWSPDSRRLVFDGYTRGQTSYIFTANRDGSATTQLTSGDDANDNGPCWSLDNRIAFQRFQPNNVATTSNLFAMAPDGSGLRAVTVTLGEKFNCTWSPDNRYIFFSDTTDPNTGARTTAVADVATGKTARLPGIGGSGPTVANDWTTATAIGVPAPAYSQIGTYDYAAGTSILLDQSGNREFSPSFVRSGPIGPMPAGFPPAELGGDPGPTPTPTATPTATPTPTPTATPTTTPAPPECPVFKVFGLRGSRGSLQDTSSTDNVLNAFLAKVKTKVPSASFEAIKYPAIPVGYGGLQAYGPNYVDSMYDGVEAFDKALVAFTGACQTSYVVVVAYSQGADAALTELESFYPLHSKAAKRILAVVTFGDPKFSPKQPKVDDGDYDKKRHGVWGELPGSELRVVPPAGITKTKSFCTAGDPICNFTSSRAGFCFTNPEACPHVKYVDRGWVDLGALWAIQKWLKR
jgi:hypothetical protein